MVEVEAPSPALSSRWNLRGSWLVEVVLDVLPNIVGLCGIGLGFPFPVTCLIKVGLCGIGLGFPFPVTCLTEGFEILLTFSTFC